jgi:hypothetical protein
MLKISSSLGHGWKTLIGTPDEAVGRGFSNLQQKRANKQGPGSRENFRLSS